jgi:predicted DNA-binding ribbon-helix-helix protein
LAERRSQSINALVAEIDAARGQANLSSAIRLFVLESAAQ